MRLIELFSGSGVLSAVARDLGWQTLTVDLDLAAPADVHADVTTWDGGEPGADLLWASPPCTEFSRESMPWCRTGAAPDLSLWFATLRQVARLRPRWWVMENVRGAQPWVGRATWHVGPWFMWGWFPAPWANRWRHKQQTSGRAAADRARLDLDLCRAVLLAIDPPSGGTKGGH